MEQFERLLLFFGTIALTICHVLSSEIVRFMGWKSTPRTSGHN